MSRFNDIDLYITEDGDLALDEDNDLATVSDINYVTQSIINRLKSNSNNWFYDKTGADIEISIGQKNTYENTDALLNRIISCLTKDGFCSLDDIVIIGQPIINSSILVLLSINTPFSEDPINFKIDFNFLTGYNIIVI